MVLGSESESEWCRGWVRISILRTYVSNKQPIPVASLSDDAETQELDAADWTSSASSSSLLGQVRSGGWGSSLHSGIEFGRSRTGEGSSGGRKRGVV